jgi:hypothetical protein
MMAQRVEVSEALVNRLAGAFTRFTKAAEDALSEAELNPEFADTVQLHAWKLQALPFLEQQSASLQQAVAHFLIGNIDPIVVQAAEKRGLGKQLDGFLLTFAGPDHAKVLERLETAVVIAAYQLCVAAGVP